ncbi:hypothetical protein Q765_15175 [Flavobacterium rivuli WB 3.3-2 = DSM 21788]|uniref:Secretion system C-terminal sorting domain-containing protein n=1 Tax=Flavobacterium rivuli WB 3.3-2 = DSM 21788 TaxID=1121895 RepID=A0A0A2M1R2_9FLAO|nr:T9SS type A sorting domain-containing protein [Flavobacterium rivuli]KGO85551.1 hypothetical protein Q765_15175 [Flavobacterium rivuli WB 3.3-2 = DSM 21788]
MKRILLLALTFAGQFVYAQNDGLTCETPHSLCNGLEFPYVNSVNVPAASEESALSYGCLDTTPNPSWFSLPIGESGTVSVTINQTHNSGESLDVNFIAWGPFENAEACGHENLNPNTQVGCSNSESLTEVFTMPNAVAGTHYIVMVTNPSNQPATLMFTPAGTTGPNALNCDVASIGHNTLSNIVLYPNPTKNSFNMTAGGSVITSVNIYDLAGKTIFRVNANAQSVTIDTSALATGTYLTEIINSDNVKTIKKLIIN